jgi:hypothetical protein
MGGAALVTSFLCRMDDSLIAVECSLFWLKRVAVRFIVPLQTRAISKLLESSRRGLVSNVLIS